MGEGREEGEEGGGESGRGREGGGESGRGREGERGGEWEKGGRKGKREGESGRGREGEGGRGKREKDNFIAHTFSP